MIARKREIILAKSWGMNILRNWLKRYQNPAKFISDLMIASFEPQMEGGGGAKHPRSMLRFFVHLQKKELHLR